MPNSLLSRQRTELDAQAQFWLAAGAASFAFLDNGEYRQQWGGAPAGDAGCIESVMIAGTRARLRVSGALPVWSEARLNQDARMLGVLSRLENDLDVMTGDLVESQDQLLALYDMAQSTRLYLNADEMLSHTAGEAARLVHARSGFAAMSDGVTVTSLVESPGGQLSNAVLETIRVHCASGDAGEWMPAREALPAGVQSLYLKRFRVRKDVYCVVGVADSARGVFGSPDVKLIGAIADRTSAYLENALLYQDNLRQARLGAEMQLARDVQARLLPNMDQAFEGLDIATFSASARDVGGDFYDLMPEPDGSLLFYVGDVSGKGMPAAMMMAVVRTATRTHAKFMKDPTPAAMLGRTNEDLYDDMTNNAMFTTMFVGRYSPTTGELVYANAGHSPVVYCPRAGQAVLLEADAPPVGVLDFNLCADHTLQMQPGDVLCVTSDGLNEAKDVDGELFSTERLLQSIELHAPETARDIVTRVMGDVRAFSGSAEQSDDQTMLVVKRHG